MQQVAMATGSGLGQVGGMQDPINALQNMAMSGTGMPPGQPQGKGFGLFLLKKGIFYFHSSVQ